jgi:hypothetical protein
MPITVLDAAEVTIDARVTGDQLMIRPEDLPVATGWDRKPEGLCRGNVCVPVRTAIEDATGAIDLGAAMVAVGNQLVFDPAGPVVAIADDPMARGEIRNLHEVSLPDVAGNTIELSSTAGKKVVLLAWASW